MKKITFITALFATLICLGWLIRGHRISHILESKQRLSLQAPFDDVTVTAWQEFRWTMDEDGSSNLVILDETTHHMILQVTTAEPRYLLKSTDVAGLSNSTLYKWYVVSLKSGKTITSNIRTFRWKAPIGYRIFDLKYREQLQEQANSARGGELAKLAQIIKTQLTTIPIEAYADRAWLLRVYGRVLDRLGKSEESAKVYVEAISAWSFAGGSDPADFAATFAGYGSVLDDLAQYDAALTAYNRSLEIIAFHSEKEFLIIKSRCLLDRGVTERKIGQFEKAKADYELAYDIDKQLIGAGVIPDDGRMADDLTNIGNLLADELEDPPASFPYLINANRIQQRFLDNGKPRETFPSSADGLASSYLLKEDYPAAIREFRRAIELDKYFHEYSGNTQTLNNLGWTFIASNDYRRALATFGRARHNIKYHPDISLDEQARTLDGFGKIYLNIGQVGLAEKYLQKAIKLSDKVRSELKTSEELRDSSADRQQIIYDLIALDIKQSNPRAAFELLETRRAASLLGGKLPSLIPPYLQPHELAIEYAVSGKDDPILAFVIEGSDVTVYILPELRNIQTQIQQVTDVLAQAGDNSEGLFNLGNQLLPQAVIDTLMRGEISHLLISPDGLLHQVPFPGLVLTQHPTIQRLTDKADIEMVPSLGWFKQRAMTNISFSRPSRDALIAIGGYGKCRSRLKELPSADLEKKIVESYASRSTRALGYQPRSADRFLQAEFSQYKVIHVISHSRPTYSINTSALLLGCDDTDVLNGASILKLKLNQQLVVLSGCETAVGRIISGEGMDSVAEAFLMAGAGCVVSTRSIVQDTTPPIIMRAFYRSLYKGHSIASALRAAQINAQKILPVREWATFTAIGDCNRSVDVTPTLHRRLMGLWNH